jgi:hypothetical protein
MLMTLPRMLTAVKAKQLWQSSVGIAVTLLGNVTLIRLVPFTILVTALATVTYWRLVQLLKV